VGDLALLPLQTGRLVRFGKGKCAKCGLALKIKSAVEKKELKHEGSD